MPTRDASRTARLLHLSANGVFPKWTLQKFAAVRHCLVGSSRTGGAGREGSSRNQSAKALISWRHEAKASIPRLFAWYL